MGDFKVARRADEELLAARPLSPELAVREHETVGTQKHPEQSGLCWRRPVLLLCHELGVQRRAERLILDLLALRGSLGADAVPL